MRPDDAPPLCVLGVAASLRWPPSKRSAHEHERARAHRRRDAELAERRPSPRRARGGRRELLVARRLQRVVRAHAAGALADWLADRRARRRAARGRRGGARRGGRARDGRDGALARSHSNYIRLVACLLRSRLRLATSNSHHGTLLLQESQTIGAFKKATTRPPQVDAAVAATDHPVDGAGAYEHASLVAQLGVLQRAYVPLQAREARGPRAAARKERRARLRETHSVAAAIEEGRRLARDVGQCHVLFFTCLPSGCGCGCDRPPVVMFYSGQPVGNSAISPVQARATRSA